MLYCFCAMNICLILLLLSFLYENDPEILIHSNPNADISWLIPRLWNFFKVKYGWLENNNTSEAKTTNYIVPRSNLSTFICKFNCKNASWSETVIAILFFFQTIKFRLLHYDFASDSKLFAFSAQINISYNCKSFLYLSNCYDEEPYDRNQMPSFSVCVTQCC